MNKKNRVENEVAIINLVAAALSHFDPKVVPRVYGWGSAAAESSQGWILQELMQGVPVDNALDGMDLQGKRAIFAQMSEMLSALQKYQLPQSITGFGGVTFDAAGCIVSAAMTSVDAGPWPSYEASYKGRLKVALAKADASPFIRGWHANGVRERLDAFVETGLPVQFQSLSSKQAKVVVHADFSEFIPHYIAPERDYQTHDCIACNNMLYDPALQRITALLDYDFACISHPSYEFLRSFDGHGGQFRGWSGDEDIDQLVLREAKLRGFPSPLPQSSENGVKWEMVKAWEDELEKSQVQRPRTIQGIEQVADVDAILRAIMPWRVTNSDILQMQSEEVTVKCRNKGEQQLIKMLDRLGF
ncbi:MAG: hypothetical protein Q9187_003472 [Circinaria calcarea]